MLALSVSIPLTTLEVDPPTGDCERQSACKVSLTVILNNLFKGPQGRSNKGEDEHNTQNQR
jgi:hypothetical protein